MYAEDPYGEWSDPVKLPFGGIDPSLFFDEDGRIYYTGTDKGIFISELTFAKTFSESGSVNISCTGAGEQIYAWNGTGGNNPEGPHLYKKGGLYYLLIAEGGTEYCHMVTVARSRSVYGPYAACPHNPVLTNRSTGLSIKAAGHADLVETKNGSWWAVCLGIRPLGYPFRHNLGRETMLVPVVWENGWPVMGMNGNGHVDAEIETKLLPCTEAEFDREFTSSHYIPGSDVVDNFDTTIMHPSWNTIYNPDDGMYEFSADGLILHGNRQGLSSSFPKALICRRQEHFDFMAELTLSIMNMENMPEGSEAGIAIYMNNRHHYEGAVAMRNGRRCLIIRRRIGNLNAVENVIDCDKETVILRLLGSKETYSFYYKVSENEESVLIGCGETHYLTTEVGGCFTGNYIAIYAVDMDVVCKKFVYKSAK